MHIQVKQVKDIKRELIFTKKENVDNNCVPCPRDGYIILFGKKRFHLLKSFVLHLHLTLGSEYL